MMMKKIPLLFILFVAFSLSAQQNYYTFQGDTYDEESFQAKLRSIEEVYGAQGSWKYTKANFKVRHSRVRQDSIIQEVEVMLSQSNSAPLDINVGVNGLINKPLPDFQLQDLANGLKSKESYNDKITLINLWFTSCPPCIAEIPYLNDLKKQYEDRVNFVAITFEPKSKIDDFLTKKPFDFEHLVDGASYLKQDLKTNTYPKLVFMDRNGTVRFVENAVMAQGRGPAAEVTEILKEHLDYLLADN
ncbi:AhpC/TSA family protein [Dokdonia sp. Hel_I_63]|uniref:TlpA family protein disulfide reductase n=1 Tax=Dokdonia sp. Hel_I_63 TaxID=1249996 RepID=UPI00119BD6A2|nr:TlpA disulfide reductase family protein [Dokdonia sp. Hel_I_63]TVZ23160.1 AhpC/TSA family protein [Dokdonia sp. Hel_I_63]